jgi:hypothetical protein
MSGWRRTLYIMFVESIFLQAEGAKLPEIKRVALADQDEVVWSESFEATLERLVGIAGERKPGAGTEAKETEAEATRITGEIASIISEAVNTFETYTDELSQANFQEAGKTLEELRQLIEQLREKTQ